MNIEFLLTCLIIIASPGTGVLYTVAIGLVRGGRMSIMANIGCTLGIVPHLLMASLGLSALLHTSALAFEMFKYIGVAYLLYIAWSTFKNRGGLSINTTSNRRSSGQIIIHAVLINLLNPKLSIFFLAFLPQFISPQDSAPLYTMLKLSAVFMLLSFAVFAIYGFFASAMRQHVLARPKVLDWMRRIFAASFLALGVKLAVSSR